MHWKESQLFENVIRVSVFSFYPDGDITENILPQKTLKHPLRLTRNVVAGTNGAIPSGQYRSILHFARLGSQSQRGNWFILPARWAFHVIRDRNKWKLRCYENRGTASAHWIFIFHSVHGIFSIHENLNNLLRMKALRLNQKLAQH